MNAVAPAPMSASEAHAAALAHMAQLAAVPDNDAPESATIARPWRPMHIEGATVPTWDGLASVRAELGEMIGRLLVAVDSGRAPRTRAPMPRYHGRPGPRAVQVTPVPVIPELVEGADAAARRETIDRVAPLLRGAVELAALLETAPADVAARARAALAKAMTPK